MLQKNLKLIGWREWVKLPALTTNQIKAKIDTGARTSTLHAIDPMPFRADGKTKIRFAIEPKQKTSPKIYCEADLLDTRWIRDSGGHREHRYVISTLILLGEETFPIELTLTSRKDLRFRMLLGRKALQNLFTIDPSASYLLGKPS